MSRTPALPPIRAASRALLALVLGAAVVPGSSGATAAAFGPACEGEVDAELRALSRDARSRSALKRQEAWSRLCELEQLPDEARPDVERAAEKVALDAGKAILRGSLLEDLEQLGARRAELDHHRRLALALILDEERYYYPYAAPHVTVERARAYPRVQREVDQRCAIVRELWEQGETVEIPAPARAAAADLVLLARARERLALDFTWPEGVPRWALALGSASEVVSVRDFAWTAAQGEALEYDRKVREHNEAVWAALDAQGASDLVRPIERDLVRLTNEYRSMMGVRALTWSSELQRAARGHSHYMAEADLLTHDQSSPELSSPARRMRKAGYGAGRKENLYSGAGGALAARSYWVRSSAHHRNLLDPALRAVGCAEERGFWTQDLGIRASFHERELPTQDHGTTDR